MSATDSADSTGSRATSVDIAETVGYVIYDRQTDGLLDDTVVVFGDEEGAFTGILRYDFPPNIVAPWLRKHVQLTFPDLGVDTFMTIDVYRTQSEAPSGVNIWEPLLLQTNKQRDTE